MGWGGARPGSGPKPRGERAKVAAEPKKPGARMKIGFDALARSKQKPAERIHPFIMANHPPSVFPGGKRPTLAQDEAITTSLAWSAQVILNGMFSEGLGFLGYPYLAELTQRAEYRVVSETLATESTRKWIKIQAAAAPPKPGQEGEPETTEEEATDADKTAKIKALEEEFQRLKVQDAFRLASEQDGFFGRSHIYIDIGDSRDDRDELITPIGNGRNKISKAKVKKGSLKRIQNIEPIWCYPSVYNANDPLAPDWYNPQNWFCMGKEIHASRLLTFVGREVPDLLKPAYSFGGLSLSQMAKPTVDNWLRTRQSVADIVHAFSVMVLSTDLSDLMGAGGEEVFRRMDFFNNTRDNRGLMAVNKETEELTNVSAPLSSLDLLQAQAQEHMASVTRTPIVKLLGIQPAGLNASSEGELKTWDDWVAAYQEKFFGEPLRRILGFAQLNLWGAVDPTITATFEPLRQMTEKEIGEIDKMEAESDQIRIDTGVLAPEDARKALAAKEDSRYAGIDPDDVPDLAEEEAAGLSPEGETNPDDGGASDEALKTLYVSRNLLNAADLIAWAKEQGFDKIMKPDQIHVTVAFSKTPVVWSDAGDSFDSVDIPESYNQTNGKRSVEKLGDKGAVVLRFESPDLAKRWKEFADAGASWDWPEYKPHVTISYDGGDLDLTAVEPYQGPLQFGPEIFAKVDEGWADKAKAAMDQSSEAAQESDIPFSGSSDEFNEADHPRAENGEFGSGGGGKKATPVKLSPKEKAYLSSYSGDDFLRLNTAIRAGNTGGPATEKLDSAISKSSVPAGTKLYRGISKDALKKLIGGDEIKVGQVLSDKGFLSTTSDSSIANMNSIGGVMLHIEVGDGQSGLDMSKISSNQHEKEVLLPRDAKLRVIGIRAPKQVGQPIIVRVATENAKDS